MTNVLPSRGRLRRPLLVVAGLAVVLAGSWIVAFAVREEEPLSKPEYEETVRSTYADVQTAFRQTRGASGPELADRVAEAQDALREAADELDAAEPPLAVSAQHDQLVQGLRDYADDLETLRRAIEAGDTKAIERFNARIPQNEAIRKIAAAAEEMLEKGYDVGPIAEE